MNRSATILGLGEVLWDVFTDGPRFGGAPANFACSVAELTGGRCRVCMVSAVGDDELGRRAVQSLEQYGVDTGHVAVVGQPTGQVNVTVGPRGDASYAIAENAAWDAIPFSTELGKLAQGADAVCFGTLGQRSGESRDAIRRVVEATPASCLRVLDLNLRPPYWTSPLVVESLELANVLKLNDAELATIAGELALRGSDRKILQQLIERFSLRLAALTRGAEGAMMLSAAGEVSDVPGEAVEVADTVGAGDAFTAGLVVGLLEARPLEEVNRWASRIAAFVCTQPGAAPSLPPHLLRP